jgi:26S proteasome regulatory subunit (ATPase 3-interacting protein)
MEYLLQDPKDDASPEELAGLDISIVTAREAIPVLKSTLKSKTATLTTLRSAPTTEALRESILELEKQKAEMESRLHVLKSGNLKPVSKEDKERVEAEFRRWAKKSADRYRIWKEAEGTLLEAMSREELYVSLVAECGEFG